MNTRPIIGISHERVKFDIVESNDVDGKNILAKVRGVFFVPDGKSRNGRFYPAELWENVVNDPEVKQRLKSRAVYGTVGHSQKIDDDAVLNGLVSHIVTDLKIEKGKGIGEALILNTPAGRNLNTILQAGGSMFVSTRADGTFEGKHQGLPVVSPKTYNFDTVDFVLDAGFVEANPNLVESYNELVKCNKLDNQNKEGNTMSEKLIEMLSNDNADLKVDVKTLTKDVSDLKEAKETLEEENKHLQGEMVKFEEAQKKMKEMEDEKEKSEEEKKELEEKLASFDKLGESAEDVEKTLSNALAHIKKVNEELGGFDSAKSALETAIDFINKFDEAGVLDNLLEAKKKMKEMEDEAEEKEKEKEAKELAEELGISEEKVKELLENHDAEGIRKMYQALEENLDKSKYKKVFEGKKKKSESDDEDEMEEEDEDCTDDISESKILSKGRVNSIRI